MRQRFYEILREELDANPRLAAVTAEIGSATIGPHPRHINVGIREQLMIGVAAGLALEGYRPVAHSYAPFLVERPYEFLKLDLGHNDLGAVLVSTGASYDASHEGRTHQAPEDVAAVAALPGWTIHVPGHIEEMERLLRQAFATDERIYLRLTEETNHARVDGDGRLVVLRRGSPGAPLVLAVGPTLRPVLEATADLDVTVAYLTTVRPFPHADVRDALGDGEDVVLVEPYLRGTSSAEVSAALEDRAHRLLALGVPNEEFRRYGSGAEHRAAHGLDAAGIRASLDGFLRRRRAERTRRPSRGASSGSASRSGGSARASR
jgi:transketolase